MDPIALTAAAVASAIANTLATEGWERLRTWLLRATRRTAGHGLEVDLAQRLALDERRLTAAGPSPGLRTELEQEWSELLVALLRSRPELAADLSHGLAAAPGGGPATFQYNTANEGGEIIAPVHGDVTVNHLPRPRAGG